MMRRDVIMVLEYCQTMGEFTMVDRISTVPFNNYKGYNIMKQGPDLTILTVKGKIMINLKLS